MQNSNTIDDVAAELLAALSLGASSTHEIDENTEYEDANLDEATAAVDDEFSPISLRRMFCQTMVEDALLPDESIEDLRARLAVDPATADVARLLQCSVEELLEGLDDAAFFMPPTEAVDDDYDPMPRF